MSYLLRTSGFPRQTLKLRNTVDALRETTTEILKPVLSAARLEVEVHAIEARATAARSGPPAHRALADATGEYEGWVSAERAAHEILLPKD